jgi:hypothetical protein
VGWEWRVGGRGFPPGERRGGWGWRVGGRGYPPGERRVGWGWRAEGRGFPPGGARGTPGGRWIAAQHPDKWSNMKTFLEFCCKMMSRAHMQIPVYQLLKVLSREMDPAEIKLMRKTSLKREAQRFLGKIRPSPILWEPLKVLKVLVF